MRTELFSRLALSTSGGTLNASEVSQAVSMAGANSCQLEVVVYSISGTSPSIAFQLQESNDLENWADKPPTPTAATTAGYKAMAAQTAVSAAYVRLKATITGSAAVAVLAAGLNTAAL